MGMIIAVAGTVFIGINDFSDSIIKLEGDFLSVISAILSALELLIIEHLLSTFTTKILMFWCCLIGSLVTMIVLIITGHHFFPVSWTGWLAVIGLALFSQVIGHGLITYSLNYLSSGVVAVTMLLDPLFSAMFAWTILSEQISFLNGTFCCIVLSGIYLALSSQYKLKTDLVS
jgi:drug/metabolite transporter (DMT)-like permease